MVTALGGCPISRVYLQGSEVKAEVHREALGRSDVQSTAGSALDAGALV